MKVVFDAFQSEVGPLVAQSCDIASISEYGFLIVRTCRGAADEGI